LPSANDLLTESQLEESYTQLIHFSRRLPQLRKTNRAMNRPAWTDRSGDYQKDLGIIIEVASELIADYGARINKKNLMQRLFEVEV